MSVAVGATDHSPPPFARFGTPTVPGTYSIVVTGSESHGLTVSYPFTLQVIAPLTIAGAPPSTGTVGTPYSGQLTVSGGLAPYTFATAAGTYPIGVSLKPATGIISGSPALSDVMRLHRVDPIQ
jgi:hypothetical protein